MTRFPRVSGLLLAFAVTLTLRAATPFAHEKSDLKPDPDVRYGTLSNGLRYAVLPNREPKERASLRLLVLTGSLNETDDQRGLAHFLEHLAFNGSIHYPPGTLVEFFQRMGMSFGGDTNASTSFDHTVYQLELPKTDTATLNEGLQVFSDYAGGLLLDPAAIDKERGVILSEKRDRDSVGFRTFVAQFDFMLGNTLLPKRIPIGQTEVIQKAARDRFMDFWNTWYRPDAMMVVVVGDVDAAAVEKMIGTVFSPLRARGPAKPAPDLGKIPAFKGVRAHFHPEPEAPATSVSITSVTPYVSEPDTAATRLKYLPRDIAIGMLNRRFSILAKKENALFVSASVSVGDEFKFVREASVDIECKPEQWSAALAIGEQELRRALEHGFQAWELKDIVANAINSLEQSVKAKPTRRSPGLADALAQGVLDESVFTAPADDLALYQPALQKLTPADCAAALREAFSAPGHYVMVTGNVKIPGDAPAAIVAAYNEARAGSVKAPAEEADVAWSYTNFGAPGKIAKREHVADLDLTLITFANGVRLNLKKTDFAANSIRLSCRIGNGKLIEPREKPGLAAYTASAFLEGGLGRHSSDDNERILSGKNVAVGFDVDDDALAFSGTTTPGDLLLELQVLAAHLVDPGYRPEADRQIQKAIEQLYLQLEHTTSGPLTLELPRLFTSGDPRFGLPPKNVLLQRTAEEEKAWLAPQFARGALEIGIVGDLDVEATIAAVAQTLGALPPRETKPALNELRRVTIPAKSFARRFTISSEIPKGIVVLRWPTTDSRDVKRSRHFGLLAEVFSDRLRLKVRQGLGEAYSPSADSSQSDVYPGFGFFEASAEVDPEKADKVADAILAIAADLEKNGVTEDELERAKQPSLTSIREGFRQNGYWLGVLAQAQEKPETLERPRTILADYRDATTADLNKLAKEYLAPARAFRVVVVPEPAARPAPALKTETAKPLTPPPASKSPPATPPAAPATVPNF